MSLDLKLETFHTQGTIRTDFVINAIDQLIPQKGKLRVIVLDNAPMHRSRLFYDQIQRWEELGLYIFFLPKYSPHLNRIEILWKKIKYEWLKPRDYASFKTLRRRLIYILEHFGEEFRIAFKELCFA